METLDLFERIFITVFPLFAIVAIGFLYAKKRPSDIEFANRVNIDIFTPALIFSVLSAETFDIAPYGKLAIAGAFVIILPGLLLWPVCRYLNISKKTFLPPMMFTNSGNLGLPLLVLAFGEQALAAAVVLFIIENALHFTLGISILNKRVNPLSLLKIPMIAATIAGIAWSFYSLPLNPAIRTAVDMLGQISIPLMLFTLGVRITEVNFTHWKISSLGAILCPLSGLIAALIIIPTLNLDPVLASYLLVFSILPPAVLNYMVAERYNQSPEQVAAIVLIGNLASVIIIPLGLYFILP